MSATESHPFIKWFADITIADIPLVGVLPTRRLLTTDLEKPLEDIMISRVIAIPHTATVLEACEFFVMHKFFAFPVVDEHKHIVGVVDIGLFTEEVLDLAEREQSDAVFEAIGLRIFQVNETSPIRAFRFRFPWLLTTIGSGLVCALLTSCFEATLAQSLVLAFFLTLVLGLGESVSIQSMTVAIQTLRFARPTFHWYARALKREATTALFLALYRWPWQPMPLVRSKSSVFPRLTRLRRPKSYERAVIRRQVDPRCERQQK